MDPNTSCGVAPIRICSCIAGEVKSALGVSGRPSTKSTRFATASAQNVCSTESTERSATMTLHGGRPVWLSVRTVPPRLVGQHDLHGRLDLLNGPGEPQRPVVHMQQSLAWAVTGRRGPAPELVAVGRIDLGLLGEPRAQARRVGQGTVDGGRRGGRPYLQPHRCGHGASFWSG